MSINLCKSTFVSATLLLLSQSAVVFSLGIGASGSGGLNNDENVQGSGLLNLDFAQSSGITSTTTISASIPVTSVSVVDQFVTTDVTLSSCSETSSSSILPTTSITSFGIGPQTVSSGPAPQSEGNIAQSAPFGSSPFSRPSNTWSIRTAVSRFPTGGPIISSLLTVGTAAASQGSQGPTGASGGLNTGSSLISPSSSHGWTPPQGPLTVAPKASHTMASTSGSLIGTSPAAAITPSIAPNYQSPESTFASQNPASTLPSSVSSGLLPSASAGLTKLNSAGLPGSSGVAGRYAAKISLLLVLIVSILFTLY